MTFIAKNKNADLNSIGSLDALPYRFETLSLSTFRLSLLFRRLLHPAMPARGDVAAKYARKRKSGLDDDTTEGMLPRGERRKRRERDDAEKDGDSDRSPSPGEKRFDLRWQM